MPIAKDITYTFHVAQGRHIACEHCGKTFTFLVYDVCIGMGSGSIIASKKKLRTKAMDDMQKEIAKVAKDRNKGYALCPHCNMYQKFMVKAKRRARQMTGFIVGTAIGTIPIGSLMLMAGALDELTVWGVLVSSCLSAMVTTGPVGWLVALLRPVSVGPHPQGQDAESMTDEEFLQWVTECEADDADPLTSWAVSLAPHAGEDDSVLLSLGVLDMTGGNFCSEKHDPQTVLADFRQYLAETMNEIAEET